MRLRSCDSCSIVIDADKRIFPDVDEMETVRELSTKAEWDGDRYIACMTCPVCGHKIKETS